MLLARTVVDPMMGSGRRSPHRSDSKVSGCLGGGHCRYLKAWISVWASLIAECGGVSDDPCAPRSNEANGFDPEAEIGSASECEPHHRPARRQANRRRRRGDLHQRRLFRLQVASRSPVQIQRQSADDRPSYGTQIIPFHLSLPHPLAGRPSRKGEI